MIAILSATVLSLKGESPIKVHDKCIVNAPCQMVELARISPIEHQVVPYTLTNEDCMHEVEQPRSENLSGTGYTASAKRSQR